jgi:uncharacterized protein
VIAVDVPPFLDALYRGDSARAEELAPPDGELDVFGAAALGRTGRVRELVDADPALANAFAPDGFQPLGLAVFFGHPDTAALLVERGADPDSPSRNEQMVTALHSACAVRDHATARLLLERGADPNRPQQDSFTPLDAARHHADAELEELLRQFGATG